MGQEENLALFRSLGAVITNDHIVFTSRKHGNAYINKDAVYPHTKVVRHFAKMIASAFADDEVDVVIAPAVGGVILSNNVADILTDLAQGNCGNSEVEILGVYADKRDDGSFEIKRGYDKIVFDKNVLIVEDVLNTGGSVQKVVQAVLEIGGRVVGVGALCNRGGVTKEALKVPKLFSVIDVTMEAWDANDCPLCREGKPVNQNVGHGREFVKEESKKIEPRHHSV